MPAGGAPECLGKRKIHPLLLRFCERRGLRCPAVITIGPADRRRRGAARGSAAAGRPGPAQAPATPEAAQAQGLPGAAPRGGAGDGTPWSRCETGGGVARSPASTCGRFGLEVATPGMSSRWARGFADLAFDPFPGQVDRVLSDAGSEYEGQFADPLMARRIRLLLHLPRRRRRPSRGAVQLHRSGGVLRLRRQLERRWRSVI